MLYGRVAIISVPIYLLNAARSLGYSRGGIINSYNQEKLNTKGYQKNVSYISLGVTNNGLGVQYHF